MPEREIAMTNTKITSETFLDSKELREQAMDKIEVLEKVKQLFLIPEFECMTVKQISDYFEVDTETIQKQYQRNKDEFDSDGTILKTPTMLKSTNWTRCPISKIDSTKNFATFYFTNGDMLVVPNRGTKCFPKRAILRMGMLLRDSRVAREIRDQLLNTFENTTEEQRTASINEEENLVGNIVRATLNSDMTTAIASLTEYISYKNRYIAEIESHNAELTQINENLNNEVTQKDAVIEEVKPKTEFYDAVAETSRLVDVGEFAKIVYKEFGKDLGRNGMYKWFRENGYIRDNNVPYQKYVTAGYFVGKMIYGKIGGHPEPKPKLFITGKGQQFILTKLKEAFPKQV